MEQNSPLRLVNHSCKPTNHINDLISHFLAAPSPASQRRCAKSCAMKSPFFPSPSSSSAPARYHLLYISSPGGLFNWLICFEICRQCHMVVLTGYKPDRNLKQFCYFKSVSDLLNRPPGCFHSFLPPPPESPRLATSLC